MFAALLLAISKLFKAPVHPFNQGGPMAYAKWQYCVAANVFKYFRDVSPMPEELVGKTVIDIGCGAGGKSVFFAQSGAGKVIGIEILPDMRGPAEAFAAHKQVGNFQFVCADASRMPFADGFADAVIISDAMEHVPDPEGVMREALRCLRTGGRIYINFLPYYHPYGAHLSDAISMPWPQVFFGERTLVRAYTRAVSGLPDADARIAHRLHNGRLSYINKITVRKFARLLRRMNITPIYYKNRPLRRYFAPLCRIPLLREMFVGMVVCVVGKGA